MSHINVKTTKVGFYTPEQRHVLEQFYAANPDIASAITLRENQPKLDALAENAGLSKSQVRMWIRNRKKRGSYKGKVIHNKDQVLILEWLFTNYTKYPSCKLKHNLAKEIGMSYGQIQKWFQTRRQRTVPAMLASEDYERTEEWRTMKDMLMGLIRDAEATDGGSSTNMEWRLEQRRKEEEERCRQARSFSHHTTPSTAATTTAAAVPPPPPPNVYGVASYQRHSYYESSSQQRQQQHVVMPSVSTGQLPTQTGLYRTPMAASPSSLTRTPNAQSNRMLPSIGDVLRGMEMPRVQNSGSFPHLLNTAHAANHHRVTASQQQSMMLPSVAQLLPPLHSFHSIRPSNAPLSPPQVPLSFPTRSSPPTSPVLRDRPSHLPSFRDVFESALQKVSFSPSPPAQE